MVDTYTYTAYGVPIATTGTDPNPFRYGGQVGYYTGRNNLILCGARWYDPYQGRWLSRDPIRYAGGPNLYEYCASNPLVWIDPSGTDLQSVKDWYMGGMGGFSDWVDRNLMFGTTAGFGETAGLYDGGDASGWDAAWAGAKFSGMLAINGVTMGRSVVGLPALASGLSRAGLAGARGACGAAGNVLRAGGRKLVTARLKKHLAAALVEEVELTPAQARAAARWPGLGAAYRGTAIHERVAASASQDILVRPFVRFAPRFAAEPDVSSRLLGAWWDVTREGQWAGHLRRYGAWGEPFGLFY